MNMMKNVDLSSVPPVRAMKWVPYKETGNIVNFME